MTTTSTAGEAVPVRSGEPAVPEPVGRRRRVVFNATTRQERRSVNVHVPGLAVRVAVPILVVVFWQLGGSGGLWSTAVLPSPTDVVRQFGDLIANGQLPQHLLASLRRVLVGATAGISIGLTLGVAVGLWRRAEQAIDATLQMLRTIPFLVILPLFILWFGVDELPKVLIIAIGTALPMYLNTASGVRAVDPRLMEMAEQFGLNRVGLIRNVVLPGAMPSILTGLRYSLGIGWLALVVAEQINAQQGLGFLISNAQALFQTEIIMVIVVVYALLGLATDLFVRLLEWRLLRWRHDPRQEAAR
jgi:sulfonate transport system permease protein